MKVIFLDIDGVLNSETDFIEAQMYDHPINGVLRKTKNGREILTPLSGGKLALLEYIILKTDAKIIISSTWREEFTLSEIHDMFQAMGFRLPRTSIVGKTEPSIRRFSSDHTYSRGSEISDWLENKDNIESYVILDDISPRMFDEEQQDHLVTTSEYDGLNKLKADKAVDILGRNEEAQKAHDEYTKSLDMMINCMV